MKKINTALISVTNKKNIDNLAKKLAKLGINIISTGGTAKFLRKKNVNVIEIEKITHFPEILNGRVKTLHPKIFGGILNRLKIKKDQETIKEFEIPNIDLIIVNLYNFEDSSNESKSNKEIIENIDIGGPSLIRAAAKNFEFKTVVVDPNDYSELLSQLNKYGKTDLQFRKYLATKAFELTSNYDSIIQKWFQKSFAKNIELPDILKFDLKKTYSMRYGENPHQKAGMYVTENTNQGIANARQIQGKDLSYNNINDADAAFDLVCEFNNPAVVIVKHANPCGVSEAGSINQAWANAFKTDPTSSFGGVVAVNRIINESLAIEMSKIFLEVIVAPNISSTAKKILSKKNNLRILVPNKLNDAKNERIILKSISGGFLIQTYDNGILKNQNLNIVSKRKPSQKEKNDLIFAWKVAKHTKSNAIIYAKNRTTTGIGAGQMSRVDSAYIAKKKSEKISLISKETVPRTNKSVAASDAFFPFADALITAAEAGITAIIQPGGSIRDKEIIEEANKRNLAMIFTSMRHFKH